VEGAEEGARSSWCWERARPPARDCHSHAGRSDTGLRERDVNPLSSAWSDDDRPAAAARARRLRRGGTVDDGRAGIDLRRAVARQPA